MWHLQGQVSRWHVLYGLAPTSIGDADPTTTLYFTHICFQFTWQNKLVSEAWSSTTQNLEGPSIKSWLMTCIPIVPGVPRRDRTSNEGCHDAWVHMQLLSKAILPKVWLKPNMDGCHVSQVQPWLLSPPPLNYTCRHRQLRKTFFWINQLRKTSMQSLWMAFEVKLNTSLGAQPHGQATWIHDESPQVSVLEYVCNRLPRNTTNWTPLCIHSYQFRFNRGARINSTIMDQGKY